MKRQILTICFIFCLFATSFLAIQPIKADITPIIYANNYDNALAMYLLYESTTNYITQALSECSTYHLSSIRTWATGSYAEETGVYNLWQSDSTTFWSRFDAFITLCDAQDVGLVINLGVAPFFTRATGDLGDPDSDSYALYIQWVTAICTRYKDNSTILMWECLNEYEYSGQPLGLAATFHNNAAGAIKAADPNHLVSSGTGNWGFDSTAWQTVNAGVNLDVASIHVYSDELEDMLYWQEGWPSQSMIQSFLQDYVTLASASGKDIFFGEVGGDVGYSGGVTSNPDDIRFIYELQGLNNIGSSFGFHSFASGSCTDTYAIVPASNPDIITALLDITEPEVTPTPTVTATPTPVPSVTPTVTPVPTATPYVSTAQAATNQVFTNVYLALGIAVVSTLIAGCYIIIASFNSGNGNVKFGVGLVLISIIEVVIGVVVVNAFQGSMGTVGISLLSFSGVT
jgi:hypothetical protein